MDSSLVLTVPSAAAATGSHTIYQADGEWVEIAVVAITSTEAVEAVREVLQRFPYVRWQSVSLYNEHHLLLAYGTKHGARPVLLAVTSMSCGYEGGQGVIAAAEVLSLLGFGNQAELLEKISQPSSPDVSAWQSVFVFRQ